VTVRVEYELIEKGFLVVPVIKAMLNSITLMNSLGNVDKSSFHVSKHVSAARQAFNGSPEFFLRIGEAKSLLDAADYVVLGIGSGFNSAFFIDEYDPQSPSELFADEFLSSTSNKNKNINDFMNNLAYISPQNEMEYWFFWGEIIWNYCFSSILHSGCIYLNKLVNGKDYFILTTNPDLKLIQSGFESGRFWFPLGNFGFLQCSMSCSQKVWNAFDHILPLFHAIDSSNSDSEEYVPRCPVCGEYLVPNRYRNTHSLVMSKESMSSSSNYFDFKNKISSDDRVVFVEMGCSLQLPYVIRYRFENYIAQHENASLIRINPHHYNFRYDSIAPRTVIFTEAIPNVLEALTNENQEG